MTDQEKTAEIPSTKLTTEISEAFSAPVQEPVLEKTTIEPAKNVRFVVVRKTKTIVKPEKKDLKKRLKIKKGQKASTSRKAAASSVKPMAHAPNETTCTLCGETFRNGVALGGHASKAHPGGSLAYKRKIEVREARAEERLFLVKAKAWFIDHFAADPKA